MSNDLVHVDALSVRWDDKGRPTSKSLALQPVGTSWWEDHQGKLRERLAAAEARGEIVVLARMERVAASRGGFPLYGALVRRVLPPVPRWRKPLIILAVVLATLALIGYGIHLLVQALFDVASAAASLGGPAALLLVLWILWSLIKGHPCPGFHCPGCGG